MRFTELLKAILFGIIEGVTEWLPISSTGHLIILNELVRLDASEAFCELLLVAVQLGAILAVPCVLWKKYLPLFKSEGKEDGLRLLWLLAVGVLPAATVGALLDDILDRYLYNLTVVALTLILYGVVFVVISKKNSGRNSKIKSVQELTFKDAAVIGIFQMLSLIPGTSRSGSTFLGGCAVGAPVSVSADFSFLMAMPIMLGAAALKGGKLLLSGYSFSFEEVMILAVSSLVSFIVSTVSIRFLIDFVKKHSLLVFGIYRILLGIAVSIFFAYK